MKKQSGQVIIILLLVMLVALSVGLAITQRSINSLTTSNQSEQAARAFSAAEAGIEKVIQSCPPGQVCTASGNINLSNQATANVTVSQPLPQGNIGLEFVPIGKEDIAQFWLSDPLNFNPANPVLYYSKPNFQIYFGNPDLGAANPDYPALEVNVLIYNPSTSQYRLNQSFYDSAPAASRAVPNGFYPAFDRNECRYPQVTTASNAGIILSSFYCNVNVPCTDPAFCSPIASTDIPIMIRVRLLYSSQKKQKIAIVPVAGTCPGSCLPPQATLYTSTGTAGQSQKTLTTIKFLNIIPSFLDFAIFTTGDINKN